MDQRSFASGLRKAQKEVGYETRLHDKWFFGEW